MAKVKRAPAGAEPVEKVERLVLDETPTVAQGRAMFEENPGLSSVVTTDGLLHRNGVLQPILQAG